jgi:hypothetical protein
LQVIETERHHEQLRLEALADPFDLVGPIELVGPRQSGAVLCKAAELEFLEAGLARDEAGHAAPKAVRRRVSYEGDPGPCFALAMRAAEHTKRYRKAGAAEREHDPRKMPEGVPPACFADLRVSRCDSCCHGYDEKGAARRNVKA